MQQDFQTSADDVARKASDVYDTLPKHGKPTVRSNGVSEWTILATISLVIPASSPSSDTDTGSPAGIRILPISLGTGVKVLPINRLPPLGDAVHDCHAEILARRGFVRWLIDEAQRVVRGDGHAEVVEWRDGRFGLKHGVGVWLYVSTVPCGDASTVHTAAFQPADMASLKAASSASQLGLVDMSGANGASDSHAIRGRNGYEALGAIRTKPGRADSVPSISMSCSDKIALWSAVGIQGGLLGGLFWPVYLDHIVVGGVEVPDGYEEERWKEVIRGELDRALWRRLSCLAGQLPEPYTLRRPAVHLTSVPFCDSKTVIARSTGSEPVTSMLSISHVPRISPLPAVLFNGGRQNGTWKAPGHTLLPEKKRTRICRYGIMKAYLELVEELKQSEIAGENNLPSFHSTTTYYDLKHQPDSAYQRAKALVRGPPRSAESLHAHFGGIGHFEVTADEPGGPPAPFKGWLVAGRRFQSFDVNGLLHLEHIT